MHKLSSNLQALIEKECKGKTHIKLTVGTLVNGEKTIQTFGSEGEIPNENYTYEIGSITKTFTTSLLTKYIHEGKMSLDDPISKYIDGLDHDYYPTLKRLVTHTAGYGYLPGTLMDGIKFLVLAPLFGSRNNGELPGMFQIDGTRMRNLLLENKKQDKDYPWAYSNFGMGLVGYAIGVASGRGYFDTMDDFLINELGMSNSYTGVNPDKNLRGYDKKNRDIGNWDLSKTIIAGTGCVSSTAEDMLTYACKHMNEELPYLALAHQKHVTSKRFDSGLAWILKQDENHVIWHNGGTGAFNSFLVIDKKKKKAYVVLSNYLFSMNKFIHAILEDLKHT